MDTGDTSPCVLLFFDQRRFIFNAGEVRRAADFLVFAWFGAYMLLRQFATQTSCRNRAIFLTLALPVDLPGTAAILHRA
jgi:hypothetical protein